MKAFIKLISLLLLLIFCSNQLYSQTKEQKQKLEKLSYGETLDVRYDICNIRIGSRDADRSDYSTFSAPIGYRILGHKINRKGHHSGTSAVQTTQAGELSYGSEAMVNLENAIRQGFLKGKFESDESSNYDSNAAMNYAKFKKKFYAKYKFVANTNAKIKFKWFVDSDSFNHGAENRSYAIITLEKVATSEDAYRAADLIKFAIESDESSNIFELMKVALNAKMEEGTQSKVENKKDDTDKDKEDK